MPTRDANMELWWLPMIPCAMAAATRSSLPRARSPPPAGEEEDTIDRWDGWSSRLQLASSSDETGGKRGVVWRQGLLGLVVVRSVAAAVFLHGSAGGFNDNEPETAGDDGACLAAENLRLHWNGGFGFGISPSRVFKQGIDQPICPTTRGFAREQVILDLGECAGRDRTYTWP